MERMTTAATTKMMNSRPSTPTGTDSATAREMPPRRPAKVLTTRPRNVPRSRRCFSLRSRARIIPTVTLRNTNRAATLVTHATSTTITPFIAE